MFLRQKTRKLMLLCSVALVVAIFSFSSVASAFPPTVQTFNIPTANSFSNSIAAGPDGNVWFVEGGNGRIGKITPSGTITEYPIPGNAVGIAPGPDGNMWFTDQTTNSVGKITPSGVVTEYAVPSGGALLQRMAAGPDGNMWFVEQATDKIGKVTMSGTITEYNLPASSSVLHIAAGPDGNVWYSNVGTNSVGKITPSGTITEYPVPTSSAIPSGLAAGPDGNMWVIEQFVGKIAKVTTAGSFTEYTIPTANTRPETIAAGPDGRLWYTNYLSTNMGMITTAGVITEFAGGGSVPNTAGITAGPDGNIWFTKYQDGQIGKLILALKPGISNRSVSVVGNSSVTVDVLASASNSPDASTLRIASNPSHGIAAVQGSSIVYTPTTGYLGTDSLLYEVCSIDDTGICAQATLSFTVATAVTAAVKAPATGFGSPQLTSASQTWSLIIIALSAIMICGGTTILWRKAGAQFSPPLRTTTGSSSKANAETYSDVK